MAKSILDFWKQAAADITDTSSILDTSVILDRNAILDIGKILGKEDDAENETNNFIVISNDDAKGKPKEIKEQKNALKVIGEKYLQYLDSLKENSTEAQALLSHSGFQSIKLLIEAFRFGSGGLRLTLRFSTHEGNSPHESAGDGQFYIHPDGLGGVTGIGAMYLKNIITLSRDIYILYKYMASREYINIKAEGHAFDYDTDINKAFNFISQILEHETCHWGSDWNGTKKRPAEFFDDTNTTELLIAGIQQGQGISTWELGQHFEWAAWGRRNPIYNQAENNELLYGAAVNIHYKSMAMFPCELNRDASGNTIKTSPEQNQEIKESIYVLLANYYPQNVRVKPNGEKDGGYHPLSPKTNITAGEH